MPNTIPYDPSLTMGNIVHPLRVSILEKIAAAQAPVTAAETNLNSLITLKRSLDATIREMLEMGVDVTALIQEGETVKAQIQKAAIEYGNLKMIAEKGVQLLRSTIRDVHSDVESPLDYNRSEIKNMPLGNNSMQLNVQYFSCETNTENGTSHAADISSFVNHALSFLGTHNAQQMSLSVQQQINMQLANHKIAGTLVISISCTHRDARIFAPLNIDVDKAVRAWNYIYPEDKIKTNSPLQSIVAEMKEETLADPAIYILSGATFGSSLVGMVHILNNTTTISMESMSTIASQIQEKMNMGAWVSSLNGEFGVTSSFATDVKNMLSTQNIQSHCSLVDNGNHPDFEIEHRQKFRHAVCRIGQRKSAATLGPTARHDSRRKQHDGIRRTQGLDRKADGRTPKRLHHRLYRRVVKNGRAGKQHNQHQQHDDCHGRLHRKMRILR